MLRSAIRYDSANNTIEIEPLDPYSQTEVYTLNIRSEERRVGKEC